MRAIFGLDVLASGEILINDQPVNNFKPKEHDTAGEFQSSLIYPNMNLSNNIRFRYDFCYKTCNQKEKLARSLLKRKFGSFCEAVQRNH